MSLQCWDKIKGLKKCCFECVFSWATTHTKCIAITWNLTTIKKVHALPTPISFLMFVCFCFACLSVYFAIAIALFCCRNQGKMWMLVTVRKARVLPTSLSFPLIFILFMVYLFPLLSPSPCLCFVVGMKAKGSCWQQLRKRWESTSSLVSFFASPICLSTCLSPSPLFYN